MRRNRRRKAIACAALGMALLAVTNRLLYPKYFAVPVSYKWEAKSGFKEIYVFPPDAKVGLPKRLLGATIAAEARPFISSYLRKSGWEVAEGYFWVRTIPFPPVVFGLNLILDSTLIDPKVTPLMKAADDGDLETVKALLAKGADVNAHDQRGWTPLLHASMSRTATPEVVQALIAAGADVHARDNAGRTALIWAPRYGPDVTGKVRVLLAAHADPNAKSSFGETPLARAVQSQISECVSLMLAAGADPNIRVENGTTVLSLAQYSSNKEMVTLLKRAGARE